MNTRKETRIIIFSSFASALIGAAGVIVAGRTASGSILADGLYSFVSAVVTLLSLPIVWLLRRGRDERFHFGYAAFEPLYVLASTAIILLSQAFVALSAVKSLASGGGYVELRGALAYEIVSTAFCMAVAWAMAIRAKKLSSPILRAETRSWFVDGLLSFGVLAAFGGASALERTQLSRLGAYVDPVITILLFIALLPSLGGQLVRALGELLSAAPPPDVRAAAEMTLAPFRLHRGVAAIGLRMRKAGRSLEVTVSISLDRDLRTSELLKLEHSMAGALRAYWPDSAVSFEFSIVACDNPRLTAGEPCAKVRASTEEPWHSPSGAGGARCRSSRWRSRSSGAHARTA